MNGILTRGAYLRLWGFWLLLAVATFFVCMMLGPGLTSDHVIRFGWPPESIYDLRLHRVLAAGIVGMALAAAGVTLQAMLRNPLAEPYVLHVAIVVLMNVSGADPEGAIRVYREQVLPSLRGARVG